LTSPTGSYKLTRQSFFLLLSYLILHQSSFFCRFTNLTLTPSSVQRLILVFFRYFSLIILRGRLRWLTVSFVRLISVTASYHVVPYQVAVKIDDLQHVIGQAIIFLLCGYYYLRQWGYVFVVVCLLATLRKTFRTDLPEIFREGWRPLPVNK